MKGCVVVGICGKREREFDCWFPDWKTVEVSVWSQVADGRYCVGGCMLKEGCLDVLLR